MLDRVEFLGHCSGLRKDEEVEFLIGIATHGDDKVMGDTDYGLAVGCRADLVAADGQCLV